MSIDLWIRLANQYRFEGDHLLADRIMFFIDECIESEVSDVTSEAKY